MDALRKAIEARKRVKLGEEEASSSSSSEEEESSSSEEQEEEAHHDDLANTRELVVVVWLEEVMGAWLASLDGADAKTAQERSLVAIAHECAAQLDPLLVLLRNRLVDPALLAQLAAIVSCCEAREYRQAHEHYLQIAIGNAPWPIGVTMVGIHARSGREKISEDKIKHLMKDETSRAYMTSVKRLMTRCQTVFPPSAPSKRMN